MKSRLIILKHAFRLQNWERMQKKNIEISFNLYFIYVTFVSKELSRINGYETGYEGNCEMNWCSYLSLSFLIS